jgi:hypothetical protein
MATLSKQGAKTALTIKQVRALTEKSPMQAWALLRDGLYVGRVVVKYGAVCKVAVYDNTFTRPEGAEYMDYTAWQYSTARGGGYDKVTACIGKMKLFGHQMNDQGKDWTAQLRDAVNVEAVQIL